MTLVILLNRPLMDRHLKDIVKFKDELSKFSVNEKN